ncbi:hypothetical protein N7522_009946 [Penicillium canescens]|nr:hypothetical protein N7522_009946 [Penicillium canescens]
MLALGVIIGKFDAMRQSWAPHALDADRTVAKIMFCRYKTPENPEVPPHRGGQNEVTFNPSDDQSYPAPISRPLTSIEAKHKDSNGSNPASPPQCASVSYKEYAFIDSAQLLTLSSEDTVILDGKGCLDLPDHNATDEFVKHYFKRIHPLVPVLDEAKFWRSYLDTNTGSKVSLFVFQSMLFASCPLVCLSILRRCGFSDRRDAREKLYNRAKLLFDLGTEKGCYANAQGAVLLTHYTSAEDPRAGSQWLARAIENTIRIDARPSVWPERVEESLKRRLWWSILLRDRSICIGLRRRPQITSSTFFGRNNLPSIKDFEEELHNSLVYDFETKQSLLVAFRRQCELAALLTNLSSLIFDTSQTRKPFLSFIEFQRLMSNIKTIKRSLSNWEESVQSVPPRGRTQESDDATATLIHLTIMYYQFVRSVPPYCGRPNFQFSHIQRRPAQYAALVLEQNLFYAEDTYNDSVQDISNDLREAIAGLTIVMEYFSVDNDADSLPLSVLGYVSMPLVLAAIDLKLSPTREEMKSRQNRLDSLGLIIRRCESLYDVTDFVAVGTNSILQLAYATTQHLFLGGGTSQGLWNRTATKEPSPQKHSHPISRSAKPRQPQSWQDAFVRCPRAYLLISTTVDYSLSFGRLPSAHDLPELVRDLQAVGGISGLPWTIDNCPSIGEISSAHQANPPEHFSRLRFISAVKTTRTSETVPIESEAKTRQGRETKQNHYISFPGSVPARHAELPQESYVDHLAQCDPHGMNLDYMEFGDFSRCSGTKAKSQFPVMEIPRHEFQQMGVLNWSGDVQAASDELNPRPPTSPVGLLLFDTLFHEAFEGNWAI